MKKKSEGQLNILDSKITKTLYTVSKFVGWNQCNGWKENHNLKSVLEKKKYLWAKMQFKNLEKNGKINSTKVEEMK